MDITGSEYAARWFAAGRYHDRRRWLTDPAGWAATHVDMDPGGLTGYQADALSRLVSRGRVAIRSPHGTGKTAAAALAVLWFALTREQAGRDWKVITTASAWRQLTLFLWPEIHKWAARIRWDLLGRRPFDPRRELLTLQLQGRHGLAAAVASDEPARVEGAHADSLLYILDEAKRLDVATPIPTPTGWTTMGDIRVGDCVFDEMGQPCRVTYVSPVLDDQPCSRIMFYDGSQIIADDGHLWAVLPTSRRQILSATHKNDPRYKRHYEPVRDWRQFWDHAEVVTTAELKPIPGGSAIPTCGPLNLPEADLPLDPYLLGTWLGDGSSWHGVIYSVDEDVIGQIRSRGYEVRPHAPAKNTSVVGYGITGIKPRLRAMDLLRNKHIPPAYLRGSYAQRLDLLRGLMDTDGTNMATGSPRVLFAVTNERLAEGVAELVRTFGWKARVSKTRAKLNGVDKGPVFILRWSASVCPFYLSRKAGRWAPRGAQGSDATIRTITSVERVPSVPTRCIAVDSPRHLYLAGEGLIPTHNTIPAGLWDAVEGAFSGGRLGGYPAPEAFALAVSTPGAPAGRFYDIHARRVGLADWDTVHITLEQAVAAGRINPDWARARAVQWGETSAIFHNRVLGEFHAGDEDSVIPLAWAEAAVERWRAWDDAGRPGVPGLRLVGVDVARSGADQTVLAHRAGHVIGGLDVYARQDTMATTARVQAALERGAELAVVDSAGIGAGVVDRLRELGLPVFAYTGAAKTGERDRSGTWGFVNTRSAAYWRVRELLDPAFDPVLALPPDEQLLADLCAPTWAERTGFPPRIQVEPKEGLVDRLGRSPDRGDAVVMALWAKPPAPADVSSVGVFAGRGSLRSPHPVAAVSPFPGARRRSAWT